MPRLARLGLALALVAPAAAFAGDGLALTPPMGWNTWNKFGCNVSEKLIRGAADAIVADRHEGRRLPVRRDRRLLAGGPRRERRRSWSTRSASPPA